MPTRQDGPAFRNERSTPLGLPCPALRADICRPGSNSRFVPFIRSEAVRRQGSLEWTSIWKPPGCPPAALDWTTFSAAASTRPDVPLRGRPGTGKTTIALQFLLDGISKGERVLFVSLSETKRELELVAQRHGWSLDGIDVFELVPAETTLDPAQQVTVFHPAEMELNETINLIFERVAHADPTRVVIDSLSELRLLAQNLLRYRRQVLALKHFFAKRRCTVILLDDLTSAQNDLQLHSISHGVVLLEQLAIDYGGAAAPARGQDARHPVSGRLP